MCAHHGETDTNQSTTEIHLRCLFALDLCSHILYITNHMNELLKGRIKFSRTEVVGIENVHFHTLLDDSNHAGLVTTILLTRCYVTSVSFSTLITVIPLMI